VTYLKEIRCYGGEMSDKPEIKKFYIYKEDYQRILDGCDLGDSVGIRAYKYPHNDQVPHLIKFVEYDKVIEALNKFFDLRDKCEELEKLLIAIRGE
jgi:hypothetical protein